MMLLSCVQICCLLKSPSIAQCLSLLAFVQFLSRHSLTSTALSRKLLHFPLHWQFQIRPLSVTIEKLALNNVTLTFCLCCSSFLSLREMSLKLFITFYATRDNLDKMFNTRSSNSNSASEFQFRLSYIVDGERCVGRACLRRRNGRKKCSRCLWQKKEMQQNNIIDVSLPIACNERETFKIEALLVNHSDHFVCVRSHREENSF